MSGMSGLPLYLSLAVATLAVSWAAIIIRLADADPIATAFYRMFFATLLMAPFALPGLIANLRRLSPSDRKWLVASGIALGLHFALWITSLKYTPISNSVVIVATQPFFVAAVEALLWKEKIGRRAIIGMALALFGMLIISHADFGMNNSYLLGDVLSLAGAFCAGTYLMFGRKIRQTLSTRHYIFPVHLVATVTLLIISFIWRSPLSGFSTKTWSYFFLLALIPTVLGHTMYNYLLKHIRAHLVAVTILGEPIGATVFAALIFGEIPPLATYIGGGLILSGIVLALLKTESDLRPAETA